MDNTSGSGARAMLPPGVDRWNWGAFFLNWIWGIGNNTFLAFLMFVPLVNLVMPFVLGAKGSAWAWRNKRWESVEAFHAAQRQWAKWGAVAWVGLLGFGFVLFFTVMSVLKESAAYAMTVVALSSSPEVEQVIGHPIRTGLPMGGIQTSGPDGAAHLEFSARGPRGEGTVYVNATRQLGAWRIDEAVFEDAATHARISFGPTPSYESR